MLCLVRNEHGRLDKPLAGLAAKGGICFEASTLTSRRTVVILRAVL